MTVRPAGLDALVTKYTGPQKPVEFNLAPWARYCPEHVDLLAGPHTTERTPGRREIDRPGLRAAFATMDLDDEASVRGTFALMMAWGGATSGRVLGNTRRALADPRVYPTLRSSAEQLRAGGLADGTLERTYSRWRLTGVGRSFFTKWFAFAGYHEGRAWQPLILDDRVFATMNKTLGISTIELAGSRIRAARYAAYVQTLHHWAGGVAADAEQLEYVLFRHNGRPLPTAL